MAKQKDQIQIVLGCVIVSNQVLLIRRNEPSLPMLHKKLEFPGGKLHFGESPDRAVEREVLEETGCKVRVDSLLPFPYSTVREGDKRRIHVLVLCYRCTLVERGHDVVPSRKISCVEWVPIEHLKPIEVQSGTFQFLRFVLAQEGILPRSYHDAPSLEYVNLESVDLKQNRKRGYRITIEANLAEEKPFKVITYYGRLPRLLHEAPKDFDQRDAAFGFINQLLTKRLRHGYKITEISSGFPYMSALSLLPRDDNSDQQRTLF
jgi:8-oxo-dGTP diphosphatase